MNFLYTDFRNILHHNSPRYAYMAPSLALLVCVQVVQRGIYAYHQRTAQHRWHSCGGCILRWLHLWRHLWFLVVLYTAWEASFGAVLHRHRPLLRRHWLNGGTTICGIGWASNICSICGTFPFYRIHLHLAVSP